MAVTSIPDGLDELRHALPTVVELIEKTSRWVHPDTFRLLPVWYPETARGQPIYDASWSRQYSVKRGALDRTVEKFEPNIKAGKAFARALGTAKRPNWTVCHIWGVDDDKFQVRNRVVQDPLYYSCVGNMVWLPTPLKGFTDCVPEIKSILRTCAFYLYDWACEHEDVKLAAEKIRSGNLPPYYPPTWPGPGRAMMPVGVVPLNGKIQKSIDQRKAVLRGLLGTPGLKHFPYDQVHKTLNFWKITL